MYHLNGKQYMVSKATITENPNQANPNKNMRNEKTCDACKHGLPIFCTFWGKSKHNFEFLRNEYYQCVTTV